jgi:hypothetical protein
MHVNAGIRQGARRPGAGRGKYFYQAKDLLKRQRPVQETQRQAKRALSSMSIPGSGLSPKNTLLSGRETCVPLPDERCEGGQVGRCIGNCCGAGDKQGRRPSSGAIPIASMAAGKMNGMDIAHGSLILFHFIQPCYLLTSYHCQNTEIPSAC